MSRWLRASGFRVGEYRYGPSGLSYPKKREKKKEEKRNLLVGGEKKRKKRKKRAKKFEKRNSSSARATRSFPNETTAAAIACAKI